MVDAGQGVEAHRSPIAIRQSSRALKYWYKVDSLGLSGQQETGIIGIDALGRFSAPRPAWVSGCAEYLVEKVPAPDGNREAPLQALIIDSWFDNCWASSLW